MLQKSRPVHFRIIAPEQQILPSSDHAHRLIGCVVRYLGKNHAQCSFLLPDQNGQQEGTLPIGKLWQIHLRAQCIGHPAAAADGNFDGKGSIGSGIVANSVIPPPIVAVRIQNCYAGTVLLGC